MKLPFALLIMYTYLVLNGILVAIKASNIASGTLYVRKTTNVFEETIVNTLTELSVIACALSCKTSIHCHRAAMTRRKAQMVCIHLNDSKEPDATGTMIEVEILEELQSKLEFFVVKAMLCVLQ